MDKMNPAKSQKYPILNSSVYVCQKPNGKCKFQTP